MSEMSVFFEDLISASKTFHQEAGRFGEIAAKGVGRVPFVSTPELTDALTSVLLAIGQGHHAMTEAIQAHSVKLKRAHDAYVHHEFKSTQLARAAMANALKDPNSIK